ncbi:MAG: diguanylate cyclase [Peptococcaceae bacterium]|jgi:predicted Fe-Mo cluster-binding NifX family protein|nr:diguanylate cyclase [Peptococcaceae bacterium]
MKICIPVEKNNGLESKIYNHFGSAPLFLIFDAETKELIKEINNGDLGHQHGMCQPMKALGGEQVNAVIVGGIGPGAIKGLNQQGIKAYKPKSPLISDNIELLKNNKLEQYTDIISCNHNGNCCH